MPETTRKQRRQRQRKPQRPDEHAQQASQRTPQVSGHTVEQIEFTDDEAVRIWQPFSTEWGAWEPAPEPATAVPLEAKSVDLSRWKNLINLKPSSAISQKIEKKQRADAAFGLYRAWKVQAIEQAHGQINLDYYAVNISRLPVVKGKRLTATEFLEHIRLNMNAFIDQDLANFEPYDAHEAADWRSASPLGSVIHIDMGTGKANLDDGSVIVSEFSAQDWTFTTIQTPDDFQHPVSGNRKFGFNPRADGSYEFYTQGADRATGLLDWLLSGGINVIFTKADGLWRSFQGRIVMFVNTHDGVAAIGETTSNRYDWDTVKKQYWRYGETDAK